MKFTKWLEFSYQHDYFDDPAAPGLLSIKPLAQTQALLADLAMQFKPTANGFFIYGSAKSNDDQEAEGQLLSSPISFAIYANDPYFANFTNMDSIQPGEKIYYLVGEGKNSNGDTVPLSEVSLVDGNVYPLQQKGLLVNEKPFTVTRYDETLIHHSEKGGGGNPLFPDPNLYYLNMTDWPDGLYNVKRGEGEEEGDDGDSEPAQSNFNGEKVFVSRALMAKPPLAILQIQIEPPQSKTVPEVTLKLESRRVFWRYQIMNEQKVDLSIVAGDAKFTGQSSDPQKLNFAQYSQADSGVLTEFISTESIPLTQAPWINIELKSLDQSDAKNLLNNLPNPQVTAVYQFQEDLNLPGTEATKGCFYAIIKVVC